MFEEGALGILSSLLMRRGLHHRRSSDPTATKAWSERACLATCKTGGSVLAPQCPANIGDNSLLLFSREQDGVSHNVRTATSKRLHQPTGALNVVA